VLDGLGSGILDWFGVNALANLVNNSGSFTIQNGRSLTTAGGFTSAGALPDGRDGSGGLTGTGPFTSPKKRNR
jgi:hypothetical protein